MLGAVTSNATMISIRSGLPMEATSRSLGKPTGGDRPYRKPTNGVGAEELLLATARRKRTVPRTGRSTGDSCRGRSIRKEDADVRALPCMETVSHSGRRNELEEARTFARRQVDRILSNVTGRFEIYVQLFPGPDAQKSFHQWRRAGVLAARRKNCFTLR